MNDKIEFYKKIFICFLDYYNCKDEYFENCINHPIGNIVFNYKDGHTLESFICEAFYFEESLEGDDFWYEIDEEWKFILSIDYQDLKFNYEHVNLIKKIFLRFIKGSNLYFSLIDKEINLDYKEINLAIILYSYTLFSELFYPSRMVLENSHIWHNIMNQIYEGDNFKRIL